MILNYVKVDLFVFQFWEKSANSHFLFVKGEKKILMNDEEIWTWLI